MHNPTQVLKIQVLPNPSEGILIIWNRKWQLSSNWASNSNKSNCKLL